MAELKLERINLLCAIVGKSKSQIANELGVSKQRLGHYISGRNLIDKITLDGIINYFGLPMGFFTDEKVTIEINNRNEMKLIKNKKI